MKKLIGILAIVLILGVVVVPNLSLPQTSENHWKPLETTGNHESFTLSVPDTSTDSMVINRCISIVL